MDETQEFLEELGLSDLEGQEITVEMVVQKVSEEEEEDDDDDDENEEEEGGERERITVQLNSLNAPVTAANFVNLVEQHFYDALAFHRFVEGFVIQGGDPQGRDPNFLIEDLGSGKYVDPATALTREIPLEIQIAETGEIVYNEIVDEAVELSHEAGVIAMARSQALGTASSQFYFPLDNVSDQLDGAYAVFGEVTDGFDFVQEVREGDRILVARVVDGDIPSRVSEIVTDSDLLNDWVNFDNKVKVSYVLSMDDDAEDNDSERNSSQDNNDLIDPSILNPDIITSSQASTIDEEVEEEGEEGEEVAENPDSEEEEDDDVDEIASAIEDDDDSEETTEETEESETESILDIDVVDSSFTTILGTEDDDVIDVLEISDVDPDSSFAIMGWTGDDEISGGNANDILSGNEGDDIVSGRDGSDLLRGGKGNDELIGGKGDDVLIGDHGVDILTGGDDADSFILRADTVEGIEQIDQVDMITDFSLAENDRIIVIAEFISSEGLDYELVDGDGNIEIRIFDRLLAVVEETSIEDIENNIFAVNPDDYTLRLG